MAQRRTLLWAIRTHMTAMRVVGFLTLMRVKTEDGSGLKVQRRNTELRSRFGALKHFLIVGLRLRNEENLFCRLKQRRLQRRRSNLAQGSRNDVFLWRLSKELFLLPGAGGALLLHCCSTAAGLLRHCCGASVTLLWHCCGTATVYCGTAG